MAKSVKKSKESRRIAGNGGRSHSREGGSAIPSDSTMSIDDLPRVPVLALRDVVIYPYMIFPSLSDGSHRLGQYRQR